jgi:hypothetical protein
LPSFFKAFFKAFFNERMFDRSGPMIAQEQLAQTAVDLRFGFVPLPGAAPGSDPAAHAVPIPGVQYTGSFAPGQRFVVRVAREIA